MKPFQELAKYDWTPEYEITVIRGNQSFKKKIPHGRWVSLIYRGRLPSRIDPGCHVSALEELHRLGLLTGQALLDANDKYGNSNKAQPNLAVAAH